MEIVTTRDKLEQVRKGERLTTRTDRRCLGWSCYATARCPRLALVCCCNYNIVNNMEHFSVKTKNCNIGEVDVLQRDLPIGRVTWIIETHEQRDSIPPARQFRARSEMV